MGNFFFPNPYNLNPKAYFYAVLYDGLNYPAVILECHSTEICVTTCKLPRREIFTPTFHIFYKIQKI